LTWFEETLYSGSSNQGFQQRFEITRIVHEVRSQHQNLAVFETPSFGRVLAINGIVQTTEKDEFAYHEMMVHVPLIANGRAQRVLIIGGGDGGVLREVLRHPSVEAAHLVEIDRSVIDVSRQFLPMLSDGAFDDSRAEVVTADGCEYVKDSGETFDIVIVDSTDPIGPGEALFSQEFYENCHQRLRPGGILVAQCGVPFLQPGELSNCYQRLGREFDDVAFYLTVIPTYVGGFLALGWASDDPALRHISIEDLTRRWAETGIKARYYSPAMHRAAFDLPPFIAELFDNAS